MRSSPVTPVNDAGPDRDPQALFNPVVEQLNPLKLAFLHVVEGQTGGARDIAPFDDAALRSRYKQGHAGGSWMVNNGYTRAMAIEAVASGAVDLVAFGRPFIGNLDQVRRLRDGLPLAPPNPATLYSGGTEDYRLPRLAACRGVTLHGLCTEASARHARRRGGRLRPRRQGAVQPERRAVRARNNSGIATSRGPGTSANGSPVCSRPGSRTAR